MANPSLQIGSGNWAIKADELLGYRVVGNKYFPVPIDVSRATAATRVDEAGLVDYAEILGGEEVTNGDFTDTGADVIYNGDFADTSIALGSTGSGWALSAGLSEYTTFGGDTAVKMTRVTTANQLRAKTDVGGDVLIGGASYKLTYKVLENNGVTSFRAYHGSSSTLPVTLDITHTVYFTSTPTNSWFLFINDTDNSDITFTDIVVKELGADWTDQDDSSSFNSNGVTIDTVDNSAYNRLNQNNVVTDSKSYKVTYTIYASAITGSNKLQYYRGNTSPTTTWTDMPHSVGTHVIYYTMSGTDLRWYFNLKNNDSTTTDYVTISSISVQESTRDNIARIDYTDGSSPHLLSEPQRDNLIPYSEDLTNAFYNDSGIETVTESTTLSPDGTNYGYTITPTSVYLNHYFDYNFGLLTVGIGDEVTYSIFVKPNGYNFIQMASSTGFNARFQNFELTGSGVIGTGDVNGKTIEKIGDWYRCSVTETTTGVNPRFLLIPSETALATRNPAFFGNATDGVLGWGFQVETGSYPTSYIPTSGAAVTRNQDQFTRDGISSLINDSEGVLFLEVAALADDGTSRCISIFQNGSNFIKFLYSATSNRVDFVAFSGGNVSCNITKVISNTTENTKFALKWKQNDFALWINGIKEGTDISGNTPLGMDKMHFTDEGGSNGKFFGKVKQLQVYPTALSDAELTTLTTL